MGILEYIFKRYILYRITGLSILLLVIVSNLEAYIPLACYLEVLAKFQVDILGFCSFS